MQKILISILGKGKKINDNYDYELTNYEIDGFGVKKTKLVSDILNEFIKPDRIYIVGTMESLWNVANEYLNSYEKVIIPYGKNEREFWEIFDIFSKLDVENCEIYFDITHGFRSIPLFVSTILNFFKNQKNATIKGVYYGIFEAKNNDITPVINMLPFIELNSWIEAGNIFSKYGDGREIKKLIENKFSAMAKEDKEKAKKNKEIKNIAKELDIYTKSIGFAAVDIYLDSIKKISDKIKMISTIPQEFQAFKYILDYLEKESTKYNYKKKWKNYLEVVEVLFYKNRYAQALTILRELMHYYIYEEINIDIDIKNFDTIISKIIKEDEGKLLNKKFLRLTQKIKTMRNRTNHAFLGEGGKRSLNTSVIELENLIKESKNLLFSEEKIILNKKNLLETLERNNKKNSF